MSEAESGQALPADAELITAIRSGDMAAYGELYRRHVTSAQHLARQLVSGTAEVDDVVAETFSRVLDLMRRGGGPQAAFRPYLLTAVRRAAYDRYRGERRSVVTGEIEAYDPGEPAIDPAVAGLERSLIARAFLSLPERWRAVLWHTEIEGARPADVAPLLGLTANGVAALAYRAREGLRQAYLQMHLSDAARQECRPVAGKLGAYVRGGLPAREAKAVGEHLDGCQDCRAVYAELADVNVALRGVVAPIFLGPVAAGYLVAVAAKGGAVIAGVAGKGGAVIAGVAGKGGAVIGWVAAKGGAAIGGVAAKVLWLRRAPKYQQAAMAGGAAAAAAAIVLGLALAGHSMPPHARWHPLAAGSASFGGPLQPTAARPPRTHTSPVGPVSGGGPHASPAGGPSPSWSTGPAGSPSPSRSPRPTGSPSPSRSPHPTGSPRPTDCLWLIGCL